MQGSVLVIGIDGGDFRTIDPLIDAGAMPNVASLLEDGYHATLESSMPPWTPTAWTSLTSGTNPGKHGVFDFETPDGDRLVDADDVRTNRLWETLTEAGGRSIVVNVPVTDPAPEIDGVVVPGFLGREVDRLQAQPADVVDELREKLGEYRVYADESLEGDALCEEYVHLMGLRRDATAYLCETYEWDFAMVEFQATDLVFHELPERRHVERVYRSVDELIGSLLETVDADYTMLVSDHGMGELGRWDVRINTWLKRRGYLETSVDGRAHGWEKPVADGDDGRADDLATRAVRGLSRAGLTPQRVESGLASVGLAALARRAIPDAVLGHLVTAGEKIDQDASSAYFPSSACLGIYCDDDVRPELLEELAALTVPDGSRPVFEAVEPAERVYHGPCVSDGPDVLLTPTDFDHFVSAVVTESVFDESRHRYNHKPTGILVATGPRVQPTSERGTAHVHDVAPTVLAALEVPLDVAFDGEPIEAIGGEPVGEVRYSRWTRERDRAESAAVRRRLEGLGYLE
ncbi:alkaline phosphatase family protein [Natronobeatus ordinarius]|uniref:alkaline phosphatase family protein n=1 Tax=Natronobeatus ordinarius TaxID=2963433 RepID=UPI0020CCA9F8|nr:alkaline phosphatase family protein [Natronobeatus ordinarius]